MYSDWKLNELPSNTSVAWPSSIRTPRTQYSENFSCKIIDTMSNTVFVVDAVAKRKRNGLERSGFETSPGHYAVFLGGIFPPQWHSPRVLLGTSELTRKCWGVTCDDLASYLGEREGLILLYASCRRNQDEQLKIFLIVSPSYGTFNISLL